MGQVSVGGSALPGVRIELNPTQLNKYGIGLEQVRTVLQRPECEHAQRSFLQPRQRCVKSAPTTRLFKAVGLRAIGHRLHRRSAVHISDVGQAVDSVEDLRNAGYANGKPSVLVIIFQQPGANIIERSIAFARCCRN